MIYNLCNPALINEEKYFFKNLNTFRTIADISDHTQQEYDSRLYNPNIRLCVVFEIKVYGLFFDFSIKCSSDEERLVHCTRYFVTKEYFFNRINKKTSYQQDIKNFLNSFIIRLFSKDFLTISSQEQVEKIINIKAVFFRFSI